MTRKNKLMAFEFCAAQNIVFDNRVGGAMVLGAS